MSDDEEEPTPYTENLIMPQKVREEEITEFEVDEEGEGSDYEMDEDEEEEESDGEEMEPEDELLINSFDLLDPTKMARTVAYNIHRALEEIAAGVPLAEGDLHISDHLEQVMPSDVVCAYTDELAFEFVEHFFTQLSILGALFLPCLDQVDQLVGVVAHLDGAEMNHNQLGALGSRSRCF